MKKLDKARVDSTIESTIPRIRSNSGDNSDTDSELSDDEGSVNGRVEGGGKKMNEKKTKAERNKMRRQNALKQEALKVQAEKRLSQDLHSIKTIAKDINNIGFLTSNLRSSVSNENINAIIMKKIKIGIICSS